MKKKAKKAVKKQKKAVKKAAKKATKKPAKKPAKKPVKTIAKKADKKVKSPAKHLKPGEYRTVYLSLGSNVGDREEYIEQAVTLLKETPGIKVVRRSSNFETQPEGKKNQPLFINCAVEITTNLSPQSLLDLMQGFEDTLGRDRSLEWGPRTIDIDILLYGNELISEDKLSIPHPLMHERIFVLEPLQEIAPNVIHPILERTIKELYHDKKAETVSTDKYEEDLPGFREVKRGIADDYERW